MSDAALMGAAAVVGLLVACGVAAIFVPRMAAMGTLGLGLAGVVLACVVLTCLALAGGPSSGVVAVPLGLPGGHLVLVLDGLSGFFLVLVMGVAAAAGAAALEGHAGDAATAPLLPVFVAGMALTLLAGDAFTLMLGFEVMSVASCGLVLAGHRDAGHRDAGARGAGARGAAVLYAGMAALAAGCLIAALALLVPADGSLTFAAMRVRPPEGARAAVVLALVLVGAGSKAGLAPLHVWLPPAHQAPPSHVSALMSGAMTKVALYVLIRVVFDLCGPAQPTWWGVPLLVVGAGSAVLGALRANMEGDIKAVLACSTVENIGLITAGLGVALAARGMDLAPLAGLAMAAALLHAMAHGMFKSLLFVGAGAVQHGAGTRLLDRLGGLIHRMPVTTGGMLMGAACLAAMPLTAGFAGEWLLLQSILAAVRVGGFGMQTLACVVAALMALAAALGAGAALRLIGVGFLGRPRTPRAAAAVEAGLPARAALLGLAGVCVAIGLAPGVVLRLAAPAVHALVGGDLAGRAGLVVVAAQADGVGYAPLLVAGVVAMLAGGVVALVRRHGRANGTLGYRQAAAWDCGFGAAPAWLPFGDPLTQYGAASFSEPLRRTFGATVLAARESVDMPEPGEIRPAVFASSARDPAVALVFAPIRRLREWLSGAADAMQFLTIRRTLVVMVGVLLLLLVAIAAVEQL
jgi:formate hydrogenlyase subunit 3/multisubunit Na+/H+ antiporter MnhD subunit